MYLQVSRGAEFGRNHAPLPEVEPTVFGFCAPLPATTPEQLERGVACVTAQDTRWARCDIKSVALLANVLLRQQAVEAGAAETILLRDGWLTDASASAVHVVRDGEILTPPRSHQLLPGHDAWPHRGAGRAQRHALPQRPGQRGDAARRRGDLAQCGDPRRAAGDAARRRRGGRRAPGAGMEAHACAGGRELGAAAYFRKVNWVRPPGAHSPSQ